MTNPHTATALRTSLIAHLTANGDLRTTPVTTAMTHVPRHLFLPPHTPIENAYANNVVITKTNTDGHATSSASQPTIIALMLEQLNAQPGMRVLEIGSGTGYNAALLTELVGPTGTVTTIDIDPHTVDTATTNLTTNGYHHINIMTADGTHGAPQNAPYDRIIVTCCTRYIPTAWKDQLVPGGRLVTPIQFRGTTRCITFDHINSKLESQDMFLCGFIPMVTTPDTAELTHTLAPGTTIHYDPDQTHHIKPHLLHNILTQPRTHQWTGIHIGTRDSLDGIWLHLATNQPGTCRLTTTPHNTHTNPATPTNPIIIKGTSLAYLTKRPKPTTGQPRYELGATSHGPAGPLLARQLCDHIHTWNNDRHNIPHITTTPQTPLLQHTTWNYT